MNICIVSWDRPGENKGGVESVCYNLTIEMLSRGDCNVSYLYSVDCGSYGNTKDVPSQRFELEAAHAEEKVRKFLIEQRIDIVWNHSPSPALNRLLRVALEGTGAKIVSIFHSTPYARFAEFRDRYALFFYRARYKGEWFILLKNLLKFPLSLLNTLRKTRKDLRSLVVNSDMVCPLSERYVREFIRLSGCSDGCFRSVTNPLLPLAKQYTHVTRKNQVLVVSRHVWKNKRIDRIIRIWRKIETQFSEWQLVILGDGPDHADYVEVAQRLGVRNVVFIGKQIPGPYYAESKIICMTSSWEGLPMVLLEAQQQGCVPIAYESFSSLPDIIENNETGFRIPAFNERLFIEKLVYLMSHEDERERMARNCEQHARKFNVWDISERWLTIFGELLNSSQG